MSKSKLCSILPVFSFVLIFLLIPGRGSRLLAQENNHLEVGGAAPLVEGEDGFQGGLNVLDTQIDLSAQYTRFTGEDMRDSYGGLPMAGVGFSFRATRNSRVFVSFSYGENKGDPFYGTPGINAENHIKVRYFPVQWGMKVDLARSTRIHVYAGLAVELAWVEETIPLLDEHGTVVNLSSSGLNSGYQLTFGPELVLGHRGHSLGLEIGWGGSKGTITTAGHAHQIDMTGYRARLFLALAL